MFMRTYRVYSAVEAPERPKDVTLVKEGTSLFAFIIPLIWLLYHRLWLCALGYVAVVMSTGALIEFLTEDASIAAVLHAQLLILFNIWVAFEANALYSNELEYKGMQLVDLIRAPSKDHALLRFFDHMVPVSSSVSSPVVSSVAAPSDVVAAPL